MEDRFQGRAGSPRPPPTSASTLKSHYLCLCSRTSAGSESARPFKGGKRPKNVSERRSRRGKTRRGADCRSRRRPIKAPTRESKLQRDVSSKFLPLLFLAEVKCILGDISPHRRCQEWAEPGHVQGAGSGLNSDRLEGCADASCRSGRSERRHAAPVMTEESATAPSAFRNRARLNGDGRSREKPAPTLRRSAAFSQHMKEDLKVCEPPTPFC